MMKTNRFEYQIRKSSRSSRLQIVVKASGEVVVTKPRLIPDIFAKKFLEQKQDWVLKQLLKLDLNKPKNRIWYRGKEYQLKFKQGKLNFLFRHPHLHISAYTKSAASRMLKKMIIEKATTEIKKQVKHFSQKMQLEYKNITLRDQKTRWGSCSSHKNLNFNWRLIMAPEAVLSYVVIHELAHLVQMNHSRKFWELVEKFDPDYREHRRWLKKHQAVLQSGV
jgi:hypothetical protein